MVKNTPLDHSRYPKKHIFLDVDNLIEWDTGIFQHFPEPVKIPTSGLECGPSGSWDARVAAGWGTIMKDNGIFRGWICCMPGICDISENCDVWLTGYIESEDGINWTKPDLKITGQKRWPGNNLLKLPGCVMSVVKPFPEMGYRYLALTIQVAPPFPGVCDDGSIRFNGPGDYLFGSDDGIHWNQITEYPLIRHGDWACLVVDNIRRRYLLYQKMCSNHGLVPRRSNIVLESKDAIRWENYYGYRQWQDCFFTDDYDDLIASMNGYRIAEYYSHSFYQTGYLYIAAQTLFMVGLPLHTSVRQNPNGRSLIRLAFSHDGKNWKHPAGRPVFIRPGAPGDFDSGFITSASHFVESGDDLLLYCSGSRDNHGTGIRSDFSLDPDIPFDAHERRISVYVAKMKKDRFASVSANFRSRFDVEIGYRQGNQLYLNALTRNNGYIRVAIARQSYPLHLCPRKDESIDGFSFDDCIPIAGDSVKIPVKFKNKKISDIPLDTPLVLRIELSHGEVFGYEWE